MSSELKEETLNGLKTGIDFLEKIKLILHSNELTKKLDQVYYIFEELVKKWESDAKTDCKPKIRNFAKLSNSTPMKPVKKIEAEKKMSNEVYPSVRNMINRNNNEVLNSVEESKPFQQLRNKSKSEENIINPPSTENKIMKKRLSSLELVRIPATCSKDSDEEKYLSILGIDTRMVMYSNKSKFCKVAKIKLKVNDKAIGARYCCLLGNNLLLGREFNDQVAEYALELGEYRLENRKNQYFELVKKEITHSFRFDKESESADWYHCLDEIIDSEVYSYIPVCRGGYNESSNIPVNRKVEEERKKQLPHPVRHVHVYDYPEFQTKVTKERSITNVERRELSSPAQYEYTEVQLKKPNWRISLPSEPELNHINRLKKGMNVRDLGALSENPNFSSEVEVQTIKKYEFVAGDTYSLNRAKIAPKPTKKLVKDRSMSM